MPEETDGLAAELVTLAHRPSEALTLRRLFDMHLGAATPYKRSEGKRAHDRRRAEMFLEFLGEGRQPHTLNLRDGNGFINGRRTGTILPCGMKEGKPVGNRMIAYDLAWLRAVLNGATLAGDGKGGRLLDSNPLKGYPLPREENPQSRMLDVARYRAEAAVGLDHLPRTAWHGFRRTFVTGMANGGASLATIAALGGWKEPQTIVRHYLKTVERTMREALARREAV